MPRSGCWWAAVVELLKLVAATVSCDWGNPSVVRGMGDGAHGTESEPDCVAGPGLVPSQGLGDLPHWRLLCEPKTLLSRASAHWSISSRTDRQWFFHGCIS